MEKETVIGQIYQTLDYDKFEIITGNRKINHSRKIGASIDVFGALLSPIIVNEKMQIIDGQNRFVALQERNLPINYIIANGYGLDQVRALNNGAKNWTAMDYIKSYADSGCKGCKEMLKFIDAFEHAIQKSALIEIATGRIITVNSSSSFEHFVFENKTKAYNTAKALLLFKDVDINERPIYNRREFSRAFSIVFDIEGFDVDRLISKIATHKREFVKCGSTRQYIDMLEDLYNKDVKKGNKLHFDF